MEGEGEGEEEHRADGGGGGERGAAAPLNDGVAQRLPCWLLQPCW